MIASQRPQVVARAQAAGEIVAPQTSDFMIVQRALDRMADEAIDLGVTIRIETDFDEFARVLRTASGWVYPSFDPACARLERDALWLRVTDAEGELVLVYAARVFRCDEFMTLLRNERLWFDRGLRAVSPNYRLLESRFDTPAWGGTVGHGGGLWVDPRARGHGLSTWAPIYMRALMVRRFDIDWQTNLVFANMAERSRRAYGYTEIERVIDGYFPPTGKDAAVYLSRMSRAEILGQLTASEFAARATKVDRQAPAPGVDAPRREAGSRPGGSD